LLILTPKKRHRKENIKSPRKYLGDMLLDNYRICSVICGADSWVDMELFGQCKETWFRTFLKLPYGIPSHDTFGRVFSALDTKVFSECFVKWIASVTLVTKGSIVAIDGKTLRRSFDRASKKSAIHMVSAWAEGNQVVLGQIKTEEKSNEITAIPKLLKMLELSGCIVTIDAMGCQKKIVVGVNFNAIIPKNFN